MTLNAKTLQVDGFVMPFKMDGNEFIRTATLELLSQEAKVDLTPPTPRHSRGDPKALQRQRTIVRRPRTFSHYVLNLPASALTFLHSFKGIYHGQEQLFLPYTESKLPLVHVYCFSSQSTANEAAQEICHKISEQLSFEMRPADSGGAVMVLDVRDVAPNKRMYCATFRLPSEVAFSSPA